MGQDVWSRFVSGGGELMLVSAVGTVIGVAAGTLLGIVAGIARNLVSRTVGYLIDFLLVFPALVLMLLLLARAGDAPIVIIGLIALSSLAAVARVMWSATREIASRDFILATRAYRYGWWRVIVGEVLPNLSSLVLVALPYQFAMATGGVATLNFLGYGASSNAPGWGVMILQNKDGLGVQPWGVILPALTIALVCVGVNLMADGMRRVLARTSEGGGQ
ncbi:ABC transporter permease [Microbacterium sp.]|uniref:ABC transporter permease n=1 Tax=Microbacterium sp. TaxID=51671 RepID=UPI0039E34401